MKALIQRVKQAQVDVEGVTVGQINHGILALIGVERDDTVEKAEQLLHKICRYRIFSDAAGKMNLSLNDTQGELLLVSQFTLVADTQKGNRPGFSRGATPEHGEQIFNDMVKLAENTGLTIQTGQFGANMQVSLINDGPVTFWLETKQPSSMSLQSI
jgi:D-tyrosyl-tRNA(Tyr) deacylase